MAITLQHFFQSVPFMFGSGVRFLGAVDQMALLPLAPNSRWGGEYEKGMREQLWRNRQE